MMSSQSSPFRRLTAMAAIALAALAACNDLQGPTVDPAPQTLPFLAGFSAHASVTEVVVTVTGARIDPALVFNFPVVNDTARGTMVLTVGTNRLVVAQAFDSAGVEILRGQQTMNVVAGTNAAVALVLNPLLGSVPVTAVIGNVTLTLTSAAATLRAGSTVALTAEVRDATGAVVSVPVAFAVSRPPAARVRADGLLTALDTGAVTVTATSFGRAASTTLNITAGTVVDGVTFSPDSLIGSGTTQAVFSFRDNVGVDSVRLRTVSPSGTAGPTCLMLAPLRGTRTLGEFGCPLVFPGGSATGRWPVSSVEVHAGTNVALLDSIALRHRGAAAVLRIVP
jgi:hypothetical protein